MSFAANEAKFSKALQSEHRAEKDKKRDAGRKPQEVMKFFGIEPGMTVLEILSSGGYYTEVLSHRVGEKGKVIAQNNKFILEVMDGRFGKEFSKRTAGNRLANVEHYKKEFGEFDLNNEVDVVTVVLNYHDMYSVMPKETRIKILNQLKRSLKPGGILGLIDMESGAGEHNPKLHRIHHQRVRDELTEAGFSLDAEASFLKNNQDDYSKMVFDPSVRGKTDRFVFKFKKSST
jgi:predicted methyltransferase